MATDRPMSHRNVNADCKLRSSAAAAAAASSLVTALLAAIVSWRGRASAAPPSIPAPTTIPASRPSSTEERPITFNTNFEGGSIGRIEKLGPATFRCRVEGQCDERGRNRQASWYFFRMDAVRGREVTVTLTDFVGEYNDTPGACPMGPTIVPVFSEDGLTWRHVPRDAAVWDDAKKELTLRLRPAGDSIWLAHVPPYTPADLGRLLAHVRRCPDAVVEAIGKTARGRDLQTVTVTDPAPDPATGPKPVIWLIAREHAWEAGTSYVMDGALRFITSDDELAVDLRRHVVFHFSPMVDVDGCLAGKVRFNANGYDVNRHWDEVDLRHPEYLQRMPEIWYTKKAIVSAAARERMASGNGPGIDLVVNLHNTETNEYLETHARDRASLATVGRLSELLTERTSFDPPKKWAELDAPTGTTNALSREYGIPVVLMEQRIAPGKKLGHAPTVEDRLRFGRDLIVAMGKAVVH
jgi:hypothetical protein